MAATCSNDPVVPTKLIHMSLPTELLLATLNNGAEKSANYQRSALHSQHLPPYFW